MKACIIQPEYSMDLSRADELFQWELDALDKCDESMDLIVLPESADIPVYAKDRAEYLELYKRYLGPLTEKVKETAVRCKAMVFFNGTGEVPTGERNRTFGYNSKGELIGVYDKQHLVPNETNISKLDSEYTWDYNPPVIIEAEGLRFAFLTCYDFYFYDIFPNIARYKPDIIIGCSHQRTDMQDSLEMLTRFCAYNCNAYVVRASVSMGVDCEKGGCSMIIAPDGKVLANLHSEIGMATAEFDPHAKYYKAAGFGNPPSAHWEYLEKGRRPWKYRPAGSAICRYDKIMPYPRICAHRGFNTVAPENSMAAFGAAVAMGAQEIEFDIWPTKDGKIVSIHDSNLERVSDGTGLVYEKTYEELLQVDFGKGFDGAYKGIRILTLEEILKKFACHVVMNIHLKVRNNDELYEEELLKKLIAAIDEYDCRKWVYIMCGNRNVLRQIKKLDSGILLCVGAGNSPYTMVEDAIEIGCEKVQLFKPKFTQEMIDKAHANGIRCNVFWSDDPDEAKQFIEMGIDTILTNDYNRIAQAIMK